MNRGYHEVIIYVDGHQEFRDKFHCESMEQVKQCVAWDWAMNKREKKLHKAVLLLEEVINGHD